MTPLWRKRKKSWAFLMFVCSSMYWKCLLKINLFSWWWKGKQQTTKQWVLLSFFTKDGWWHTSSPILLGKPQLYTKAWNVKHKKVVQSSRSNIYVLTVIKILCSLKTLTAWAITTAMMSVTVVTIFENFMTSTDCSTLPFC